MPPPTDAARALPLALCLSALAMAAVAVAFWLGVIDVGPPRTAVAALVGLVAVLELAMGLFLLSRSRRET